METYSFYIYTALKHALQQTLYTYVPENSMLDPLFSLSLMVMGFVFTLPANLRELRRVVLPRPLNPTNMSFIDGAHVALQNTIE